MSSFTCFLTYPRPAKRSDNFVIEFPPLLFSHFSKNVKIAAVSDIVLPSHMSCRLGAGSCGLDVVGWELGAGSFWLGVVGWELRAGSCWPGVVGWK